MKPMVTLVNYNIEELYIRCQEINYIGSICCSIIRFIYSTRTWNIAQWVSWGLSEICRWRVFNNSTKQRNYAWLLQFTFIIIRKPFHVNFVSPSFYSLLEVCKIILFLSFANCSPSHLPYWQTGTVSLRKNKLSERKGKSCFSLLLTQQDIINIKY